MPELAAWGALKKTDTWPYSPDILMVWDAAWHQGFFKLPSGF